MYKNSAFMSSNTPNDSKRYVYATGA